MKIALVSLNQVWEDKKANQELCINYLEKVKEYNVDLIVFPEMTLTGFSMNIEFIREKEESSQTISFFSEQAKKYDVNIAFGVVFEIENKATNNLVIINKQGIVISTYAKIHPFSYSGEDNYYIGGDKIVSSKLGDATMGSTICYDLRFPEIYQALSKNCNVVLNIANWPESRVNHWNTLLEARAIENQMFMIGVNRTGEDGNKVEYTKSSAVFNPLGAKLKPKYSYLELDVFEIVPEEVQDVRKSFSLHQDRKVDFYKSIL